MTTFKLSTLFLAFGLFIASCGGSDKPDAEVTDAVTEENTETTTTDASTDLSVNTEASVINWRGFKPTGKDHTGTLKLSSGSVQLSDGALNGGKFVIDMTSMDNTDLKGTEGHAKLLGHLKSEDFFNVAEYPEAHFAITNVEAAPGEDGATHKISGDLTIKGITKNITFPATVKVTDNGVNATAAFVIDRSQWDIKFGSTSFFPDLVGDKVISNDLELNVALVAGGNTTM